MGFRLTCAICSPVLRHDIAPDVTFWYMDEILNCGYINRKVQGVIDGGRVFHAEQHVHDIAGTAFISLLFKRFLSYYREMGQAANAPPFLFRQTLTTFDLVREWQQKKIDYSRELPWEELASGAHRIIALDRVFGRYQYWPDTIAQFRHNSSITNKSQHTDINGLPMSWIPCVVMTEWMNEFWEMSSTSRLQLDAHLRAKARLMGWHEQLRAYAPHGAYMLVAPIYYPA